MVILPDLSLLHRSHQTLNSGNYKQIARSLNRSCQSSILGVYISKRKHYMPYPKDDRQAESLWNSLLLPHFRFWQWKNSGRCLLLTFRLPRCRQVLINLAGVRSPKSSFFFTKSCDRFIVKSFKLTCPLRPGR